MTLFYIFRWKSQFQSMRSEIDHMLTCAAETLLTSQVETRHLCVHNVVELPDVMVVILSIGMIIHVQEDS